MADDFDEAVDNVVKDDEGVAPAPAEGDVKPPTDTGAPEDGKDEDRTANYRTEVDAIAAMLPEDKKQALLRRAEQGQRWGRDFHSVTAEKAELVQRLGGMNALAREIAKEFPGGDGTLSGAEFIERKGAIEFLKAALPKLREPTAPAPQETSDEFEDLDPRVAEAIRGSQKAQKELASVRGELQTQAKEREWAEAERKFHAALEPHVKEMLKGFGVSDAEKLPGAHAAVTELATLAYWAEVDANQGNPEAVTAGSGAKKVSDLLKLVMDARSTTPKPTSRVHNATGDVTPKSQEEDVFDRDFADLGQGIDQIVDEALSRNK